MINDVGHCLKGPDKSSIDVLSPRLKDPGNSEAHFGICKVFYANEL